MLLAIIIVGEGTTNCRERTLKWWSGPWGPSHPAWNSLLKMVASFEQEHNVKVEITPVQQQAALEKLTLAVTTGMSPDVYTLDGIGPLVETNMLMNITPYVKRSNLAGLSDYPSSLWKQYTVDNIIYAAPTEANASYALVYHKGLFNQAGIAFPSTNTVQTWEDIWLLNRKLTTIDSEAKLTQRGIDPLRACASTMRFWVLSWGTPLISADGKPVITMSGWREILENIAKPYWEYGTTVMDTFNKQYGGGWSATLSKGRDAMVIDGSWTPNELLNAWYAAGKPDDAGYTWMPQQQRKKAQYISGWAMSIPMGAKEPDLAWEFIEWFSGGTGAKAWREANNSPFIGPVSRPDVKLLKANPGLEWYANSIMNADVFLDVDPNPIWNEADRTWKSRMVNPVLQGIITPLQAQADYQLYLETFLSQ